VLKVERVPNICEGVLGSTDKLHALLGTSILGSEAMEGVYIRLDKEPCLALRAKYVRKSFLQPDEIHWSKREIEPNRLKSRTERLISREA
jgi:hypothetical protein